MNQLEGTGPPPAEQSQIDALLTIKIGKDVTGNIYFDAYWVFCP